jgi:hypothetical protein
VWHCMDLSGILLREISVASIVNFHTRGADVPACFVGWGEWEYHLCYLSVA